MPGGSPGRLALAAEGTAARPGGRLGNRESISWCSLLKVCSYPDPRQRSTACSIAVRLVSTEGSSENISPYFKADGASEAPNFRESQKVNFASEMLAKKRSGVKLRDEEVPTLRQRIVKQVQQQLGGRLRG